MEKRYWKGIEELNQDADFVKSQQNEFAEELPVEDIHSSTSFFGNQSRRDFLKLLGFSISAATIAASCRIPVQHAIPYVIRPEEIVPGLANYYASTFQDGNDFCPVLMKVRDGRPIKVEPLTSKHISEDSPYRFLFGGTSARAQGSILWLYDSTRTQQPTVTGKKATWDVVDAEIRTKLNDIKSANGTVRILTPSILSPSTRAVIQDFSNTFSAKRVVYDPVSYSAIAMAHGKNFGKQAIPGYHFENANVIVSIAADFLGTWISPIEFARQYAQNRKVSNRKTTMSRHYQFESRLSLTGTNSDKRAVVKPSEEKIAAVALYNKIAAIMGGSSLPAKQLNDRADKLLSQAAGELAANKGKSLVVCGCNDVNTQMVVNAINNMLGNYGSTINLTHYSNTHQVSDQNIQQLMSDMNNGSVSALIIYGANPVYDYFDGKNFSDALKKVSLTISLNDRADETTTQCHYHCPDHSYLESWNDAEARAGLFTMCQPTIWPLFQTRQAQESLMRWMGSADSFYAYIKKYWQDTIYPKQTMYGDFISFWDNCVKEGVIEITPSENASGNFSGDVNAAASAINDNPAQGLELILYEKVGIGNGRYGNIPWLQELPDPVSKMTWDNYLCVPKKYADANNLNDEDVVTLKAGNASLEVPVFVQPGQCDDTFSLALGYGRTNGGRSSDGVGVNAYPLVNSDGNNLQYLVSGISISKTGKTYQLATTQTHFSFEGRNVIQQTSLEEYAKNPNEGLDEKDELKKIWGETLYPKREFPGAKWAMSIDLNSCIGCGACTVSCYAENNVPVVGKTEVRRVHEMTWLRIDRYYSFPSENGLITKEKEYNQIPDYQNVQVIHQPMLCQHCQNAPCENVCPVAATNHSSEGLNQMAYNRCIGTRYCANNCPYKVRRFNWLDYTTADVFPWNEPWKIPTLEIQNPGMTDPVTRMVLNPDVVVRSRGVMEKCSFCVQRIQDGKLNAKKQNRLLQDGDIKTACQTACPTEAIVFGNINDDETVVTKNHEDARGYYVLADLNTRPSIAYMKKVRNTDPSEVKFDSPQEG